MKTALLFATTALFALLLATSCCQAFSVSKPSSASARPDASSAVEEALKITAAFGINSEEARVAWDIVEEMDASDNSQATAGSLDTECPVEEEPSPECLDYGRFLDQLTILRDVVGETTKTKSSLIDTLKNIKLSEPEPHPSAAANSPELDRALQEARVATDIHGIRSVEARLAWETYEEIAASGTENAYGVNLVEECSVEAGQEACQAMEELERVMPILLAMHKKK